MSSNVAVDPGDLGGTGLPPTNHLAGHGAEGVGEEVVAGRSATQLVLARLRHDKVAIASLATIVIISLAAICAPLISRARWPRAEHQYLQTGLSPSGIPLPPNWTFLFGTDDLGRDVLVRVVYGARISLLVGVAATGISITVGVVIGLLAGYYGSVVDTVLARFMDVVLSLPYLVFALALISIVGPSLWISIVVIAFFSWATVGRVVRGQTLMLKEREFVEAARSIGTGDLRIMFVEILPNVMAPSSSMPLSSSLPPSCSKQRSRSSASEWYRPRRVGGTCSPNPCPTSRSPGGSWFSPARPCF